MARNNVRVCGGRAGFAQESIGLWRWINTLYPNEGLQRARTGIVTGPFAKGTFFLQLARSHFTFQDDLRIGGIGQPGDVTADHFGGRPPPAKSKRLRLLAGTGHEAANQSRGSPPRTTLTGIA